MRGCRSAPRCRVCGEEHNSSECTSKEEKCCLCNEGHSADINCSARAREIQVLEIIERRRCSRQEAISEMQARTQGYAAVTARHTIATEASLSIAIADAVERAMEKAMERLAGNLCESLSQILTNQMAQIFGTTAAISMTSQTTERSGTSNEEVAPKLTSQDDQIAGPSVDVSKNHSEGINVDAESSDEMDMDPRSLKRSRSPLSKTATSLIHSKTKKYLKDNLTKNDFLKDSILNKAVTESILSQP